MGVPTSEVGYTPAMPTREDYEVYKGHVMALGGVGSVSLDNNLSPRVSILGGGWILLEFCLQNLSKKVKNWK